MKHRRCLDNVIRNFIDFSISDSWIRQFMTDVILYKPGSESDHRLLVTKLTTTVNYITRFHRHKPRKTPKVITSKFLKIIDVHLEFRNKLVQIKVNKPIKTT